MEITFHFRRLIALILFTVGLTGSALVVRAADVGIQGPNELRVWFLNVGQGDSALIVTPNGRRLLIDGGPDQSVLAKLGQILPPWDRRVDAILLTHPDADHVTGLVSVLGRYRVGIIYETGLTTGSGPDRVFANADIPRRLLQVGDQFDLDGVHFDVLSPVGRPPPKTDKTNDFSLVVRMAYGDASILFTGDVPAAVEKYLSDEPVASDVLKVAHHGSKSSSDPAFLDAVQPAVAVISLSAKNTFGHPHPVILNRLHTRSIQVWRTDQNGDILLTTSGGEPETAPRPLPF